MIQTQAMGAILGCTKDTSAEAMRYLFGFPTMLWQKDTKMAQVKAFLKVTSDPSHPLHKKVGRQSTSRLKRGAEWMTTASKLIEECVSVESIRLGASWQYLDDLQQKCTRVVATLERECRDWAPGQTDEAVEAIIEEVSSPGDAIAFTDGSVKRGERSGWAFTIRIDGQTVAEGSGAVELTTSSMLMEVKAITEALRYMQRSQQKRAVIVTDSMSTLEKVRKEHLHADWLQTLRASGLERITWVFSPGHAGVRGNERADVLAGTAPIDDDYILDPPTVLQIVKEHLVQKRPPSSSYTVDILKDKGIQVGEGASSTSRGALRRRQNQLLLETISLHTLRWSLLTREEQMWECPSCQSSDVEDR